MGRGRLHFPLWNIFFFNVSQQLLPRPLSLHLRSTNQNRVLRRVCEHLLPSPDFYFLSVKQGNLGKSIAANTNKHVQCCIFYSVSLTGAMPDSMVAVDVIALTLTLRENRGTKAQRCTGTVQSNMTKGFVSKSGVWFPKPSSGESGEVCFWCYKTKNIIANHGNKT